MIEVRDRILAAPGMSPLTVGQEGKSVQPLRDFILSLVRLNSNR